MNDMREDFTNDVKQRINFINRLRYVNPEFNEDLIQKAIELYVEMQKCSFENEKSIILIAKLLNNK